MSSFVNQPTVLDNLVFFAILVNNFVNSRSTVYAIWQYLLLL